MVSQSKGISNLDQLPDEAQSRIAKLRLLFVARCQENLDQIRQVLDKRTAADGPATQDPELIKLAHSLAGASAIFGYQELGLAASRVELTLRQDKYPDADFALAINALIEQLSALG